MKKFILSLLLSAFVFVSVHDYVLEAIDYDTQSELYLYESGQISEVCDVTHTHQILHDTIMAINTIIPVTQHTKPSYTIAKVTAPFVPLLPSKSIYHPPIV